MLVCCSLSRRVLPSDCSTSQPARTSGISPSPQFCLLYWFIYRHKYGASQLQLTANRSTHIVPRPVSSSLSHYHPRQCTLISDLSSLSSVLPYREFDTVGLVVHLCVSHMMSRDADGPELVAEMVYFADSQGGIMVMKVRTGLKVGLCELKCCSLQWNLQIKGHL